MSAVLAWLSPSNKGCERVSGYPKQAGRTLVGGDAGQAKDSNALLEEGRQGGGK
jgi:hypothetical protein